MARVTDMPEAAMNCLHDSSPGGSRGQTQFRLVKGGRLRIIRSVDGEQVADFTVPVTADDLDLLAENFGSRLVREEMGLA